MTDITKDNRYCSLDVTKKLGIKSHSDWVNKNIIKNKEQIEKVTGEKILIETIQNTSGKPTKIAYLTEPQVVYLVSNSANSKKTGTKNMKDELAVMFRALAERAGALEKLRKQWSKFKDQIVNPNFELYDLYADEDAEPQYLPQDFMNGFFSADVVFAEFLEKLESEVGYSLKWDFGMEPKRFGTFTPEQLEALKTYVFMTDDHFNPDGSEHEHMRFMWGEDILPDLGLLEMTEDDGNGVAWITEPKGIEKAWQKLVKKALKIVEVYNSPELRAEHGIASHEEQATGWWDGPDENCKPLAELLKADAEYTRLLELDNNFRADGFQAHKDWIDWLQLNTKQARMARELHLGSPDPVVFESYRRERQYYPLSYLEDNLSDYIEKIDPRTKYVQYQYWLAYENGKEWQKTFSEKWESTGIEPVTPPLSPDRPLFEYTRVYSVEFKALFDWYLNNIWLPQHSVKFFQTIDPEGFPKLCEAMKALPPNSALPHTFIQAMQPQLAGI